MNSLTQYIDLYRQAGAQIESGSPSALNRRRAHALQVLEGSHLAEKGDAGYENTSLNDMYAPDYGVNVGRVEWPRELIKAFRCDVPNLSTLQGYLLCDTFVGGSALETRLPAGVTFTSLADYARRNPEFVEKYYGRLAPADDPAVALNTLLCMDGAVIHVQAGVELDRPLQIVSILGASTGQILAPRRLLVVMERGSRAQVMLCDHTLAGSPVSMSAMVAEIFVGEDASLQLLDMEESQAESRRHAMVYASQSRGSELRLHSMTLSCGTTRNDYCVSLDDTGCTTMLSGMVIGSDRRHADNRTVVRHMHPRCHSTQLFKYVLDDVSTGAFDGSIYVAEGAHGTEAYQNCRNLLASKGARMHSRPQLEIYNDDVKCSHGAATGQLDEEALFYMRTRGIPLAEARTMLMQAFMTDVIDTVNIEGVRDRLRHLVERRFAGATAACRECSRKMAE